MLYVYKARRFGTAILLMGVNFAISACGELSSPIEKAYYTGGDQFSTKGGYTRTIFSTSNF